jgi:molybdopterin molybdotransferase
MTGALLPAGADTVVQVELTDGGAESVTIRSALPRGANVRGRGEDMRAGSVVLRSGIRIGPAEIGVLAGVQKRRVRVGRRPSMAIITTGDEIVDVDQPRRGAQVVNSNAHALAALAREAGAEPRVLPVVPDSREPTIRALETALDCEFIVTTGGVSVGAYDFVKEALEHLGAETMFWRVAMKPGKPVVLARLRDRLFFGLPGNPASCQVAFTLFVAPAVRKASGQSENLFPPVANARAARTLKGTADRRDYLRVRLVARDGELRAVPMPAQGSGVSTSMVQANALAILDVGTERVEEGSLVPVMIVGAIFSA